MTDIIENKRQLLVPKVASVKETLDELLNTEKSLARFGDGEFGMMFSDFQIGFQQRDAFLLERLKEVLASDEPNLMIGLQNTFGALGARSGKWREWTGKFRDHVNPFLNAKKQYYDSGVTRVQASKKHFLKLKQIWVGKKVVTIEGSMCRLGVGNDLFDNVGSLRRILAPAECAFSAYDRILEEALKLEKDTLFLIALGPTATVLAYDLCKAGYRALDIGHLDICYELFLRNEPHMVAIEGKYVNEASYRAPAACTDPGYLSQIIAEVKLAPDNDGV
jgi:glycosyltransferase family protein